LHYPEPEDEEKQEGERGVPNPRMKSEELFGGAS
jgi:hypothetical protein